MIVVAIDIGGTFTDLIGFDEPARSVRRGQEPDHAGAAQAQGIIDCIRKSGLDAGAIDELIHGSTIAINTLIERKGAKTGLIVTRGTRDVYIIGRGNRPEAYNLLFHRHRPLVAAPPHARGRGAAAGKRRRARASCRPRIGRGRVREAQGRRRRGGRGLLSCIPTSIQSTSARRARSCARHCPAPICRCRTKSCASIASSSASRRRWSTLTSARRSAAT